ncbi:hypothetical protein PACTADRAFT_51579 [Pachysolen tannophilus NRRL Y-2460]|uniref:Major facilitator superfamily (MFS) profile domain-containing protein n=1 Tax=Pachysolen tannophilus NRRL Y-2460 TaxID=669874 RepID=A0A1E4TQ36_PACTA|nr:hypothetical protein PACTADRAFT_51579 [Pachysolen tannophilus NRRL Y-2460]
MKTIKKIKRYFMYGNEDEDYGRYHSSHQKSSLMAIWIGLFCALGGFLYGYDTGVINGLLAMKVVKKRFAANGESFTALETAEITAILSAGTFFGALFASVLSDRVGRRLTIILTTSLAFPLGTALQVSSSSIPLLCTGRFVSGFAVGIISAVVPLYQSEASPKWIRGAVVSTYQFAITWGLLVSSAVCQGTHAIGDSRSYRVPIGLQLIWTYILAIGMYFLPESPRFYVKKDRLEDAIEALSRLRKLPPSDEFLIEELIDIKAQHDYELSFGKATLLDCFRSSPSRHKQFLRMMTGIGLQALQQSSGINFIFYYGVNFFEKAGVSQSYIISLVTYAVNVIATIPGIVLVEVIGRRKLLVGAAGVMTVANLTIAIVGVTTDSLVADNVMIVLLCIFIATFASSWGPVVWVICSEIYPLDIRGKAVSITAASNWIVNFAFAFITPYLIDTGKHTASLGTKIFFIWGGCNFIGAMFVYFCVYETKGLMLEEVDEMYNACNSALSSGAYKSKLHRNYSDNNDNDNDNNINNGIESDSTITTTNNETNTVPTSLTVTSTSTSGSNALPLFSSQDPNFHNIVPGLDMVTPGKFLPNLTTSKQPNILQQARVESNQLFHVNLSSRPPSSVESVSSFDDDNDNDDENCDLNNVCSDDDEDEYDEDEDNDNDNDNDGGLLGGERNIFGGSGGGYINEVDLSNFINSLKRERLQQQSMQEQQQQQEQQEQQLGAADGTIVENSHTDHSNTCDGSEVKNHKGKNET